jgi:hypothetical protein
MIAEEARAHRCIGLMSSARVRYGVTLTMSVAVMPSFASRLTTFSLARGDWPSMWSGWSPEAERPAWGRS